MGAAIGGLGSLLGGMLGNAIAGKGKGEWAVDTRIPGVTSATIKKGGKGGKGKEEVPQIDVSQSLKWFQEAADTQTKYYQEGLNFYTQALKLAAVEVNEGYRKANTTLQPLSESAGKALNEQMRMLGLDPISATASAVADARHGNITPDIQRQIAAAEKLKTPQERADALREINNSLDARKQELTDNIQEYSSIISSSIPDYLSSSNLADSTASEKFWGKVKGAGIDAFYVGEAGESADNVDTALTAINRFNDKLAADYQQVKAEYGKRIEQAAANINNIENFKTDYNAKYTPEYDAAYTGAEIEERVASTPGYQFQLEQGTKAIERQGAAKGMLGSGNTLTALTQYGQQLGQNFYGVYMDNLSRIVNEGSPATMQISANQINQGKDYGALIEAGGNAAMQTQQLIGNAKADSLYRQGALYADAAKFNASMQYAGMQAGRKRETDMAMGAMNNAAGIMNAQTTRQNFNYGVFQNQQGGQAYSGGGGGGSSYSVLTDPMFGGGHSATLGPNISV